MCDASKVCFDKVDVERTCRSCKFVDVLDKGVWKCAKWDKSLSPRQQEEACVDYELGSMFNGD